MDEQVKKGISLFAVDIDREDVQTAIQCITGAKAKATEHCARLLNVHKHEIHRKEVYEACDRLIDMQDATMKILCGDEQTIKDYSSGVKF